MPPARSRKPPRKPEGPDRAIVREGRRRADRAKFAVVIVSTVAFGASIGIARASYTSRPKHPARALAAPARFERVVQENQLGAGVIAPQQASSAVQTSTS